MLFAYVITRYFRKSYCLLYLSCLFGLLVTTTPNMAHTIAIGRYLSVALKAEPAQSHLLQQQIEIQFPKNILTINEATQFMLQFSGYRLAPLNKLNIEANVLLEQPLPEVDRTLGPISLTEGLETLSGKAFYLLVDPIHRKVGFLLKPTYQTLYKKPSIATNIRLKKT